MFFGNFFYSFAFCLSKKNFFWQLTKESIASLLTAGYWASVIGLSSFMLFRSLFRLHFTYNVCLCAKYQAVSRQLGSWKHFLFQCWKTQKREYTPKQPKQCLRCCIETMHRHMLFSRTQPILLWMHSLMFFCRTKS